MALRSAYVVFSRLVQWAVLAGLARLLPDRLRGGLFVRPATLPPGGERVTPQARTC